MTSPPKPPSKTESSADIHQIFIHYLEKQGLRQTKQRKIILDAVLAADRHVDAETIAREAHKIDASIGLATVYRTLRMMTAAQILVERKFQANRAIFEFADRRGSHHDHLICNECGDIFEFFDEDLEAHQERIAQQLGFELIEHKMELYGRCHRGPGCKYNTLKETL